MPMQNLNFVAVDVETATSLRTSICSIALVKVVGGSIIDTHYTLIRPQPLEFNYFNTQIHGITAQDVTNAPTWAQAWPSIHEFMEGHTLVAHNAPFDKSAIARTSESYGISTSHLNYVCTVRASRRLLSLENNKLPTVANYLGVDDFNHHDAYDDAKACAEIAIRLSEKFNIETIAGF